MTDSERMQQVIESGRPCVWISTYEEAEAKQVVGDAALALRLDALVWSSVRGVESGIVADERPEGDFNHPIAAMRLFATTPGRPVCVMCDLSDHLSEPRIMRALRELIERFEHAGGTLVLIDHAADPPAPIAHVASTFELSLPGEQELESILRTAVRRAHQEKPVRIDIKKSSLDTIVRNLRGLSRTQADRLARELIAHDRALSCDDVNHALAAKRRMLHRGGLLEYVEAPVDLTRIGGLAKLKKWLSVRRGAFAGTLKGVRRPRGVLLLGVQGAGKSYSAKAVATAWGVPLLRLDPGSLYDRYVGESERRLRDALRLAEAMSPVVLWIDEIEKGFASAASHSIDGGLSQRMFGRLLTWMQEREAPVFLVATANNIEALPPELLRKGRFDEIFFVDLPARDARSEIFAIHLGAFDVDARAVNTAALAEASEGFSGAEIETAIAAAFLESAAAGRTPTEPDILASLRASPPLSVTMAERVADLRAWARDRCAPAD